MASVFLSHKYEEKKEVLVVNYYLDRCLVDCWIDKTGLEGGNHLAKTILPAIETRKYFVAFLSERFMNSAWCIKELESAFSQNKTIIPVLLSDLEIITKAGNPIVNDILRSQKWVLWNEYDRESSCKEIADAVFSNELIRFKPISLLKIGDMEIQHIELEIKGTLPPDLLSTWKFDIQRFLSDSKDDEKPIRRDIPVAFSGRVPNWLYAFLTIPLANNRDVFIYNTSPGGFICTYARKNVEGMLGKVLPYSL